MRERTFPPSVFSVKAIFFDMDGTLIDSREDVYGSLAAVLASHGRSISDAEMSQLIGKSWEDVHEYLDARIAMPISLSVMQQKVYEERLRRVQTQGASMLPGVEQAVHRLSALLPCAVVTGSSRHEAELLLQSTGLLPHFSFLICAGETARSKPAPDPYLFAAQKMDLDPAHCLAIEDSPIGIASANAAGMPCVGVQAGNFTNQDQSAASFIMQDFHEIERWFVQHMIDGMATGS